MTASEKIRQGRVYLGIELGSTRIKACLIDEAFTPLASGSHSWENRLENGFWTYSLDEIHHGIRSCYASLAENVMKKYGEKITCLNAMGISGMMHGYMAFDENNNLLVPFRTWRNTSTAAASAELTGLLGFNIPQRWSIAHLYQAILNGEEHIPQLAHLHTLASYLHFRLTGRSEAGLGEASGMFPIEKGSYNEAYLAKVNELFCKKGFDKPLEELLPTPRCAGFRGALLTAEGALFLDPTGNLRAGIQLCPPEGDAGTGMTATNSVRPATGNISAGTSVFSMLTLDKPLSRHYSEIDIVTTPDGAPVAMVHCNNGCGEIDAWVNMFVEFAAKIGSPMEASALYELLYANAMQSCAGEVGITAYNFISAEPIADVDHGYPMYLRKGDSRISLGSFFRAQLYAIAAPLKIGTDILFNKEKVHAEGFMGHGGLFTVKGAAQQIFADSLKAPIMTMQTAGEGGAWGMSLLAAYMICGEGVSLADFLEQKVFADMERTVCVPDKDGMSDFTLFMKQYCDGLSAQKALSD